MAFANASAMSEYYHSKLILYPAFGLLKEIDSLQMWKMFNENSKGNIKIEFSNIKADEYVGAVEWMATYNFSKNKRKVVNAIRAQFQETHR